MFVFTRNIFDQFRYYNGGRDSSVGTATRYVLDGPGIESRWGARYSAPVQTGPGSYPASCTMGTGSFPWVMQPGRGTDHPPPSKRRGHERVELYLYSPSGPSWPIIGRTFTFRYYNVYKKGLASCRQLPQHLPCTLSKLTGSL